MRNLKDENFDASNYDRFLAENCDKPNWIVVHPTIWNGSWRLKYHPRWVHRQVRKIGRIMKNKYIYWIGLPIYWENGLKEYIQNEI